MTETKKYVYVTYRSLDELMNRRDIMTHTMINRIDNEGNKFKITDSQIEIDKNKYYLKFTLEANI